MMIVCAVVDYENENEKAKLNVVDIVVVDIVVDKNGIYYCNRAKLQYFHYYRHSYFHNFHYLNEYKSLMREWDHCDVMMKTRLMMFEKIDDKQGKENVMGIYDSDDHPVNPNVSDGVVDDDYYVNLRILMIDVLVRVLVRQHTLEEEEHNMAEDNLEVQ
jgi:hypothetical protein